MKLTKWEEVEGLYPALNPHSAFDLTKAELWKGCEEGSRAPTVKAAVEVSVLWRKECKGV
jgi:hypothetical protein